MTADGPPAPDAAIDDVLRDVTFVDASALVALADRDDASHAAAVTAYHELVAAGYRPAVVARVAQISRQAIYRTPKPRRAPESPKRPPADAVEAAIVAVATENPTDGYRMVRALVVRRLGLETTPRRSTRAPHARVPTRPSPPDNGSTGHTA